MQYDVPQTAPPRRLTRSRRERMIFGVAGGLAEYFDLDPVVMRLLWVAAAILTGGLAVPAYIVMIFVMPDANGVAPIAPSTAATPVEEPTVEAQPTAASFDPAAATEPTTVPGLGPARGAEPWQPEAGRWPAGGPERRRQRQRTAGIILITLGVLFLAGQTGIFWWINWRYVWPLILIAIGVGILLRQGAWRR